METRASYILVGVFTLAMIAAAFAYVFWAAKKSEQQAQDYYLIHFDGSVSGLSVTAPVLLNGVRVGEVIAIQLSRDDARTVDVAISVNKDTPIREDSVATLEAQGLTGTSRVAISGGTNESPMLTSPPERGLPVIRSETAGLQAIMRNMPQVLNDVHNTLQHIDTFLSEKNRGSVEAILSNAANITARIDRRMDNIDKILLDIEGAAKELNGLLTDLRPAGKDLSSAMAKFEDTMSRIDKVASAAAPGLEKFSRDGVDDFRRFMVDARLMLNSLNRLVQKMENDPRRFLFGQTMPEYDQR